MQKQKLWTRVRNVFRPDRHNGLTANEIQLLQKAEDANQFKDLLYEPIQMYVLMVQKYGHRQTVQWLVELLDQEYNHKEDQNEIEAVIALGHDLSNYSDFPNAKHFFGNIAFVERLKQLNMIDETNGLDFLKSTWDFDLYESPFPKNPVVEPAVEPIIEPVVEPVQLAVHKDVETTNTQTRLSANRYSYAHPISKGKLFTSQKFMDWWEQLPETFSRQSAFVLVQSDFVQSQSFFYTMVKQAIANKILKKVSHGYYEKIVQRTIDLSPLNPLNLFPNIEVDTPKEYKMVEEKKESPTRNLPVVSYYPRDFQDDYDKHDWISVANAQIRFGLNKKYINRLVVYNHLKIVGKATVNHKWICVVNFGELEDYCNKREQMASVDGYNRKCESCNNDFNAWNENVLICRNCISQG